MPAQMQTSCRAPRTPISVCSGTQTKLDTDPGRLFRETHRFVDREHRPVALVVPRLDVVDATSPRVTNGRELQGHGESPTTCLAPHAREPLPDERGVLDRPLQIRYSEPASLGIDRDEEGIRQKARRIDPVLAPLLERHVRRCIHRRDVPATLVGEVEGLARRTRVMRQLVSERADADALRGHPLRGAGEPLEIEVRDGKTGLPVALHLDPAALLRELDPISHRLLHAGRRRQRVPIPQDLDAGLVERTAMAATSAVGQHPDVKGVPIRMEARWAVVDLDGADDAAILLDDDPCLEEPAMVPLLILMTRFLDRPR